LLLYISPYFDFTSSFSFSLTAPHCPSLPLAPLLTLLSPPLMLSHMPRHRRVLDVAEQRGEEVEKAQEKIQKLTRKNSSLQEEKGALESQVAALEVDHGKSSDLALLVLCSVC
jgi:hypothetical protein